LAEISAAVIFNDQTEVLLQLRDVKSGIRSSGLWSLPGGSLEVGETSLEAVVREVKEETGLVLCNPIYFLSLRDMFEGLPFVDIDFYFIQLTELINLEVNEGQQLKFIEISELASYDKNLHLDFVINYAFLTLEFTKSAQKKFKLDGN
jgi:mutator protein MutT